MSHVDIAESSGPLARAGKLAEGARNIDAAVAVAVDLSESYLGQRNYPGALAAVTRAMDLAKGANASFNGMAYKANQGIVRNRLGDHEAGLRLIREALAFFQERKDLGSVAILTTALAEEYAFAGDFRHAYEALRTLNNDLDRKRISEATDAIERDMQDYQIAALKWEQQNQARLRHLWLALGLLGSTTALVLAFTRRKLKRSNLLLGASRQGKLKLIQELGTVLAKVKTIQGLIPICSYCKQIRDDKGVWNRLEEYFQSRSEATFSHGICPACEVRVKGQWRADGML